FHATEYRSLSARGHGRMNAARLAPTAWAPGVLEPPPELPLDDRADDRGEGRGSLRLQLGLHLVGQCRRKLIFQQVELLFVDRAQADSGVGVAEAERLLELVAVVERDRVALEPQHPQVPEQRTFGDANSRSKLTWPQARLTDYRSQDSHAPGESGCAWD